LKLLSQSVLLGSLSRDAGDLFLELVHIKCDERIKSEVWLINIEVLLDQAFDLSPMCLAKVLIS
jgi:hypothetical protein